MLICGGGTGGHVYPALVVAEALQAQAGGAELLYAGACGSIEERLAGQQGIPFARLEVMPATRYCIDHA